MKCLICGKRVIRADLCNDHNREYGVRASDRPEWLNFLANSARKERRQEGETFSLDYCDEVMGSYPEQRLTGVFRDVYGKQGRQTEKEAMKDEPKFADEFEPLNEPVETSDAMCVLEWITLTGVVAYSMRRMLFSLIAELIEKRSTNDKRV